MTHKLIHTPDYLLVVDDSGTRIAHLPLNDSPILEGVDLLPPLEQEDDAECIANKLTQGLTFPSERRHGIILGYNKAKEKYKYTEEDVLRIIDMAKEEININPSCDNNMWVDKFSTDEIIQSLSQPKMPVEFECEMEVNLNGINGLDRARLVPKTTTNSQGQIVWAGKYIY